jgi:hypothetical protein
VLLAQQGTTLGSVPAVETGTDGTTAAVEVLRTGDNCVLAERRCQ